MPGGAFIQRSKCLNRFILTTESIEPSSLFIFKALPSLIILAVITPNYKKMTFRQARQWLIDKKIIGSEATANAIGYRIPTQNP